MENTMTTKQPATPLLNISVDVTPSYPYDKRASASWEEDGARFHVWFDVGTKEILREYGTNKKIIYKNPPHCIAHNSTGDFKTRYLDGDKTRNADTLRHVFAVIERDGLIAKGIAIAEEKERQRQAQSAEAERQERIRDAAPKLVEALRAYIHGDAGVDGAALLRSLGEDA